MKYKKLAILMAAMVVGTTSGVNAVKKINVDHPGTLSQKVKDASWKKGETVKISGCLNSADVIRLRELCGQKYDFSHTEPVITSLDLSEVSFAENDTTPFAQSPTRAYRLQGRNNLPEFFMYETSVEHLVLPANLDTAKRASLSYMPVRELKFPGRAYVHPQAYIQDSMLRILQLPKTSQLIGMKSMSLDSLRFLSVGDVDYVPGGCFTDLPNLEEVEFNGLIGHIDGYTFTNLPKLKRISFNGPVSSTGGSRFAYNCPELEEINIRGVVIGLGITSNPECPRLKAYRIDGAVLMTGDSAVAMPTPLNRIVSSEKNMAAFKRLLEYRSAMMGNLTAESFLRRISRYDCAEIAGIADSLGLKSEAAQLLDRYEATRNPDEGKTKLQILKESPSYQSDSVSFAFRYAPATDSILVMDRKYYNLDSIAGNGCDSVRIKRITYWLHDLVRHDGSSSNPQCRLTLKEIADVCHSGNRGVNCRMMAIMLLEAFQAVGIPARYLTCQPKGWDDDSDCHVICVAWDRDNAKWVWADPTFAAFVFDENGMMLHPGEVRQRLIEGKPLSINPDANWNHSSMQTIENYLYNYMAKNLYFIEAVENNFPAPEGNGRLYGNKYILLSPKNAPNPPSSNVYTSDELRFWCAPDVQMAKSEAN